ncbi:patronin isoform X3 [Cylas formicarius]|uniref:patronin isoform X3 n=1 Tax=Cylas formicarius TaxID=197179 RepID=UPI0029584FB6|nr:patronin isoform X3 [Cylas formicarius]
MWSAFSKIFNRNSGLKRNQSGEVTSEPTDQSDNLDMDDTFTKQAKHRASIKWLLSKAFNNKVPENLREPFYKDHEGQEHLKPQIVGGLANAEIYCRSLANIYSDPNYHSLNHSAILMTLSRKGVSISEPSDGGQLTETTLIQTNPLRMNAHMVVIESIMLLYAREVVTPDRVLAAVQRFSHGQGPPPPMPKNHEQGLLMWVEKACEALQQRLEQDRSESTALSNGGGGDKPRQPHFHSCRDLKDLCDGSNLAALISFYCPDELSWSDIKVSQVPSVQGSLQNLQIIHEFCDRCLPSSIFHLEPEDIFYMSESLKSNLIVFLADLFNVIEIHPANCIKEKICGEDFPARNAHGVVHKRNLLQPVVNPIPDLRSGIDNPTSSATFQVNKSGSGNPQLRKVNSLQQSQQSLSEFSEDSIRPSTDESFVVYKGRNIPTLRSVLSEDHSKLRGTKERQDERAEVAAGKPSNWDENKKTGFAGRRSRRNSMTDESQLTIENFGGSQDNLSFIGRNPDKEVAVHVGRKISAPSFPVAVENPRVRSSVQDARGSLQLGYDNGCEKEDSVPEDRLKRQMSSDDITLMNFNLSKEKSVKDLVDDEANNRMSFADLGKQKNIGEYRGINFMNVQEKEDYRPKSSFLNKSTNGNAEKKTSFDTLPNTTTWQQQSLNTQSHETSNGNDNLAGNNIMATQLNDIRLKLEEKRRHIESEKRRMEMAMNKQRQKVGKAAFLQAVTKGRGNLLKSPSNSNDQSPNEKSPSPLPEVTATSKPQRPFSLQEISSDVSNVERKWFDNNQPYLETRRTPDLDNMDLEQYQKSIAQMNSSLTDIQSDIQQLAAQQSQLQLQHDQKLIADQQRQILHMQQQQYQTMQRQQQQQYAQPYSHQPQIYQQQGVPVQMQPASAAQPIPVSLFGPTKAVEEPQFFLHDHAAPVAPPRRTWAQQSQLSHDRGELKTWGKPQPVEVAYNESFVLHDTARRLQEHARYQDLAKSSENRYHNGDHSNSFTLSQQYHKQFATAHSTPSASPQHHNVHRQISQLLDNAATNKRVSLVSLQQMDCGVGGGRERKTSVTHAPVAAPPADDMEPQNISFIGNSVDTALSEGLSRINIVSGTRTYRIPSPTRPHISRNSFQPSSSPPVASELLDEPTDVDDTSQKKGFYISFDNDQPKRTKPPLRTKRMSPKKERSFIVDASDEIDDVPRPPERQEKSENRINEGRFSNQSQKMDYLIGQEREKLRAKREASQEKQKVAAASAIVIGNELTNPNPEVVDELERKKERLLMLSLQRRQQQEEAKAKKEAETQRRREFEKAKEEEKARKKEEQAARRAAILEQYKLKKAIEEAEREGKILDKQELLSLKPTPKMRSKGTTRPRPKTIHIDSGSVQLAEGLSSRDRKGSTSNLTAYSPATMKRDYYRGSQDSLNDRSMSSNMLYRDSPDDSHGMSPCHSANQTLGRRSSYKTSRGSSTDQDSLAYRFGDTDSGLGRATPPRRAPSPGMSLRHLPSPSGPGSLPGLMSKGRRAFDDGSSDISSTPSSMMDYSGPKLYKQPATKSNRSIMLNAVEYCVFPGVVNREAKRRVLEEINRSESKHFLILFRDAGCQFRALYSYCPDTEAVNKLYGTGPKQVNDKMFDRFFKYNSGGKCFSQVHTKHLTVTIDAFTIHNSLWQGKKVNLPNKKDMALVV